MYICSYIYYQNSSHRERQQQLEELTKELGRIQDEADSLRVKLKQYKHNKVSNCFFMTPHQWIRAI